MKSIGADLVHTLLMREMYIPAAVEMEGVLVEVSFTINVMILQALILTRYQGGTFLVSLVVLSWNSCHDCLITSCCVCVCVCYMFQCCAKMACSH